MIVLLLDSSGQILSVSAIDILCAATSLFIDCGYHNIENTGTQPLGFFALRQQHADVEERAEIEESNLRRFVWDINVLSKT